jgi:transcriptional regulator with PAS, ATPase and Fis domain
MPGRETCANSIIPCAALLFCDGKVVRPEHVSFYHDLSVERPRKGAERLAERDEAANQFALDVIIREHVRRVYEMADRNQREAARILRISRGKLSRHLRGLAPN